MTKTKLTNEPTTGLWNTPIGSSSIKDPLAELKIPKKPFKYKRSKAIQKRLDAFGTRPTHLDTRLIY